MAESRATTARSRPRHPRSIRAEAEFRAHVEQLGGSVLEPDWLGSTKPHRALCPRRHECTPRPNDLKNGRGMCRVCAGLDPATVRAAFRASVERLGGTILEAEWLGNNRPHRIRCKEGHVSHPYPAKVAQGIGICRACGGNDPGVAWAAFRTRLAELGATLLEPDWLGSHEPHRVLCRERHDCRPTPTHIAQGKGPCLKCKGRVWDVLYVVAGEAQVKFGVTSGNPRPRLLDHARAGLDEVVRLHQGLPDGVASGLERLILSALRDAREEPLRGREYYPAHVLPLVLDLVDNHPAARQ